MSVTPSKPRPVALSGPDTIRVYRVTREGRVYVDEQLAPELMDLDDAPVLPGPRRDA